jgi:hypothetical protein
MDRTAAPERAGHAMADNQRLSQLYLSLFLAIVVFSAASVAPADAAAPPSPTLYEPGHFPLGNTYVAEQAIALKEGTLPDPTYITGRFLCLENHADQALFTTFSQESDRLVFGKLVLSVTFFGNCPPRLHAGSVISPDSRDPLTIKAVFHRSDLTVVTAESRSLPQKQNNK